MMFSSAKLLDLSNRTYCLLLHLYPTPFRREFGYHMAQVFRDDVRDTLRESGKLALLGLWLLAFFDLLQTAVAEHFWEIFHMPIEKLTRWSGVAAAIGAPLFVASFSSQAFWEFIDIIGLADFEFTHPVLVWIGLLLMTLGTYDLYRRLPSITISTLTYSIVLLGVLAGIIGLIMGEAVPEWLSSAAFILPFGGVACMGVIALTKKSLGDLSFAPLLTAVAIIGFVLTIPDVGDFGVATHVFLALHHIGWALLGIALMLPQSEEPSEPGLFA